jgi:hypothetical protein
MSFMLVRRPIPRITACHGHIRRGVDAHAARKHTVRETATAPLELLGECPTVAALRSFERTDGPPRRVLRDVALTQCLVRSCGFGRRNVKIFPESRFEGCDRDNRCDERRRIANLRDKSILMGFALV